MTFKRIPGSNLLLSLYCIIVLLSPFIVHSNKISAQVSLTLEEAYQLTESHYPLLKSVDILDAIKNAEHRLIDHSRKPIIELKSDVALQSEAFSLGSDIPNSPINIELPLYNVKAYGSLSYNLYDGGLADTRKRINEINMLVKEKEIEVDLYPLREQVNKVFSGVLLAKNLLVQYDLTFSDLEIRIEKVKSAVLNGILLESELTKLEVRKLEIENDQSKIVSDIYGAYATLSVLTGQELGPDIELAIPEDLESQLYLNVKRPEFGLLESRKWAVEVQKDLIDVSNKPHLILFGRAGLAYPNALNFSKVQLAPYAIGGVSFSYKLFDKSDLAIKKQKIDLESDLIDIQKEIFEQNLLVQKSHFGSEFAELEGQITRYRQIAVLQSQVLQHMAVQVDNGVITSSEYLIQSNAELRARQNIEITKSQLIKKKLEYITINGNPDLFSKK